MTSDRNYAGTPATDEYSTSTGTAVPIDVTGSGSGAGLVHEAQERAAPIVDRVRDQTSTQLSSQKDRASETMTSVADAVRQTGERLREGDQANIAQYTDMAAEQIERLSSHLRERDLNSLVREVEDVARRQPALVIGGAFVAGLLAARFLKSSNRQQQYAGFEGREDQTNAAGPWESAAYDATAYEATAYQSPTTEAGSETTGYGDAVYEGATGLGATQTDVPLDDAELSDTIVDKTKTTSGRSRRRRSSNAGS